MDTNFFYLISQKNFCYPRWLAKLTIILIHPITYYLMKLKHYLQCLLFALSTTAQAQETLTNQSIVSLVKAKISAELIIDKIKVSPTNFDLTTKGVIELTKEGANGNILEVMMLTSDNLPILRNQDIIDLHLNRIPKDVILNKIMYSECNFNTTVEGMVELKNSKVPDAVVKVVMDPKRASKVSQNPNLIAGNLPPHPQDLPPPARGAMPEPGIYYEDFLKKPIKYDQLEPTTSNNTKQGSAGEAIGGAVSQSKLGVNVVGTKQRIGLVNPSANFVIQDNRPVFYMVFEGNTRKKMDDVAESVFFGVASPNDFTLMGVKPKRSGRDFVIGQTSDLSSKSGFSEGAIPFRFKKISNTLYKIYFEEDIAAAEYAFFYNKGSEFTSSLKLFDFSLRNNVKGNK